MDDQYQTPPPYFQKLAPFLVVLLLVTGLGVSMYLVRQRQQTATRASIDLVDLALSAPAEVASAMSWIWFMPSTRTACSIERYPIFCSHEKASMAALIPAPAATPA